MFRENYHMQPYNFYMTEICKQLLKKFHFKFLHIFNFPVLEIKKNIVTFLHNTTYMVNSFLVSLEISVMVNILFEMIKILHEKMLNAVYLY